MPPDEFGKLISTGEGSKPFNIDFTHFITTSSVRRYVFSSGLCQMFSCCSRCFFSFAELINKCAEGKYEIELIEGKRKGLLAVWPLWV